MEDVFLVLPLKELQIFMVIRLHVLLFVYMATGAYEDTLMELKDVAEKAALK